MRRFGGLPTRTYARPMLWQGTRLAFCRVAAAGSTDGLSLQSSTQRRNDNLRISGLPDHTADNRISSDFNAFRPTRTTQVRQEAVTAPSMKGRWKGTLGAEGCT